MSLAWLNRETGLIAHLFWSHFVLSVLAIALALALPSGWVAQRGGVLKAPPLGAAEILDTVPTLALCPLPVVLPDGCVLLIAARFTPWLPKGATP